MGNRANRPLNSHKLTFADFAIDLEAGELHKNGSRVRLQDQPFQLLALLTQRTGEVVTREELRRHLWSADTFVDFDNSLNAAVAKIREALADSPENPKFIETLPRRGYRFIAPVQIADNGNVGAKPHTTSAPPQLALSTSTENSASHRAFPQTKLGLAAGLLISIVVLVAVAFGVYTLLHRVPSAPFQDFSITQITDNGKTVAATVSPDGKYLLSVLEDNGKESLLLRNIATNSDTQVLPPADAFYKDPIFSPDGNYIYFRKSQDSAGAGFDLFRAPVLGGTPQPIGSDFDSGISFSPGGRRIVFMRANDPEVGKFQVLTARADGTDSKMLYGGPTSDAPRVLAWSPDGNQIASLSSNARGPLSAIDLLDMASTKVQSFVRANDRALGDVVWLPSGRGFLTTYEPGGSPPLSHLQIGFVTYPGGEFRPITKDTNSYQTLSLSVDGKTLAAVQQKAMHTLYLMPARGFTGTQPLPAAAQSKNSYFFDWAGNSEVYFDGDLQRISVDGSKTTTLFRDPEHHIFRATGCPLGQYIVFAWQGHPDSSKTNLWRIDADGANPKQLSHGVADVRPACSDDGHWVYYSDLPNFQVKRIPIGGGEAEAVPGAAGMVVVPGLALSRDGRFLMFVALRAPAAGVEIAVVNLIPGAQPRTRILEPDPRIVGLTHFTPDNKSLVYVIRVKGADNLWLQPLDGSPGRELTEFVSDRIQNYEFSPDGKILGVFRSHIESDVVLLRDDSSSPQ